jgi:septal ring factor EnvC (AmiA/AmiB activator)
MTKGPLAIIAMILALGNPARAEIATLKPAAAPAMELRTTEHALQRSAARQEALMKEAAALRREQDELSGQLVETAARIRAAEIAVAASQDKIAGLSRDEASLRIKLTSNNDTFAELLAGLIKLERNPPPALLASPSDALHASRAAMLFNASLPLLRSKTSALSHDLSRLVRLRASIASEREALSSQLQRLRSAKGQLDSLHARKKTLLTVTAETLTRERQRAAELAAKAKTLKHLVEALAEEKRRREEASAAKPAGQAAPASQEPAFRFGSSQGRLDYPVHGQLIRRFGDTDSFGGRSKGMYVATGSGAQVTSPAPGRVAFAGNFRSYGQLLILDVGEGYHVLLAGMARIRVETGHAVAAGEPLGEMGDSPAQAMVGSQLKDQRPIIYVEFRKAGDAVDPSAWWIGSKKEARNQKGMN